MKKGLCMLLALAMLLSLAACGAKPTEPEEKEWTREGYFSNEQGNMLSVIRMDDVVDPGWYVGCMLGEDPMEDSWGGMLPQEGDSLHGALPSSGSKAELTVTVSEEGEDGLQLQVEGGETYHFTRMELPEATITITINTQGGGNIAYAEGEATPEIDPEYPFQSAWINLAEPAVHTLLAWPNPGQKFVKWTKNGEDVSTEPQITLLLDESADFIAVFEADGDWQNPVMNFVGEYQSGRAHAKVECIGDTDALITIEWGSSAWELARWTIFGTLDTETLTLSYSGCPKYIVVYDDSGEIKSEEPEYEDGTGTITFREDGSFVWHEDQSAYGEDMVFEWVPVMTGDAVGLANPWREATPDEAKALCIKSFDAPEGAENVVWTVLDAAADPSGVPGALVQLSFDWNGSHFTAREQITGEEEMEQSGLYYTWTFERDEPLKNWADGNLTAHMSRHVGENECVDLCTWYDAEAGVSYSLSVAAEDLDGFDLLAVAEAMYR